MKKSFLLFMIMFLMLIIFVFAESRFNDIWIRGWLNASNQTNIIQNLTIRGNISASHIFGNGSLLLGVDTNPNDDFTSINASLLTFSNMQLSNISNNTLVKGDNISLALWNSSSNTIFLRELSKNINLTNNVTFSGLPVLVFNVSYVNCTMVSGVCTINTPYVEVTTSIQCTSQSGISNFGSYHITARTSGVSFEVTSTNVLESNVIGCELKKVIT